MRDGPLRRAIKRIARFCYETDLRLTRGAARMRGGPAFELGGECRLCAKCCEAPSVQISRFAFRLRSLRALHAAWHRHLNGFELTGTEAPSVLVFRCTHFDPTTRRCDSYESRPGMCRDYPRNLLEHPAPEFLEGCGYFALNRRRAALETMLAEANIPAEKRRKIDEVFRLKDRPDEGGADTDAPPSRPSE